MSTELKEGNVPNSGLWLVRIEFFWPEGDRRVG
jgi:hypothetical protein